MRTATTSRVLHWLRLPGLALRAAALMTVFAIALAAAGLAAAQESNEPDPQLIATVEGYAEETQNGFDHVWRWVRVLKTFGIVAIEDMSVAEAQGYADRGWERWVPVTAALQASDEPDSQLIADIRGYARGNRTRLRASVALDPGAQDLWRA